MKRNIDLYISDMLESIRKIRQYTLIHVYFGVSLNRVRKVITDDLDGLNATLEKIKTELENDNRQS